MKYDTEKLIREYHSFLEQYYLDDIKRYKEDEISHVTIDLNDLVTFNPDLIERFIDNSEEDIALFRTILQKTYQDIEEPKPFHLRITNVNEFSKINLSRIRAKEIGKLISITGMLKRKSTTMVKCIVKEYLCTNPTCSLSSNKVRVPQDDEKPKELKACPSCKAPVELINEEKKDFLQLHVQELAEDMANAASLPETKLVEVYGELTDPDFIDKFIVGSKIEVIAVIKERIKEKMNKTTTVSTTYLKAVNLNSLENDFLSVVITEEDKKNFQQMIKEKDMLPILQASITPDIAGRNEIKKACLLYVVGGTDLEKLGIKEKWRCLSHFCIIGDASLGKSQITKRLNRLLPRTVYVSAENATGVGLVGAAVKDPLSGEWTLEAGALPLANNGYFLLDEGDKMAKTDHTKMNEALEDQESHINKAGIRGMLKTNAPCFMTANPKNGKFDESMDYGKQINFDSTFLSRFDLIFIVDGIEGKKENDAVINKILGLEEEAEEILDDETLVKYLMYAKSFNPIIPKPLMELIRTYFKNIQNKGFDSKALKIAYRQLGGLMRMSEAFAKLRLSNEVCKDDVKQAIELMNFTLNKFSTSEIETGISNKSRNIYTNIEHLLESETGKDCFTIQELKDFCPDIKESDIEKGIETLKSEGVIFEPVKNMYRKTA